MREITQRPRRITIKISQRNRVGGGVTPNKEKRRALVNTVTKLRLPLKG
jgi:hypothetical protein